jgi:hypothetical protein
MNKGDKVICIKDLRIFEFEPYFEINGIYDISFVKENKYVTITDGISNTSLWTAQSIQEWKKFSDYFMTMAEWRQKQINSILDD